MSKFGHSDLFLRLEEAARERLATLRVHLDPSQQEQLVTEVCDVFVSGGCGGGGGEGHEAARSQGVRGLCWCQHPSQHRGEDGYVAHRYVEGRSFCGLPRWFSAASSSSCACSS